VLKFAGNSSKLKRSSNCKQEEKMKYRRKGLKTLKPESKQRRTFLMYVHKKRKVSHLQCMFTKEEREREREMRERREKDCIFSFWR
jgi:hypothetical protein